MTSRNGGRIPPDGRTPQAPGIGRNAKRHDLERPKTPGLHGSDLQMGDIQQLEQGQRIQGIKQTQQPAQNRRRQQALPERVRRGPSGENDAPDPVAFLKGRLSGTLDPRARPLNRQPNNRLSNVSVGMLGHMASMTGTSGLVAQAYLETVRANRNRPTSEVAFVDLNMVEDMLAKYLEE